MSISYVGVDLRSSKFHQVALNHSGTSTLNREFLTSEANLVKAFSDLGGEIQVPRALHPAIVFDASA